MAIGGDDGGTDLASDQSHSVGQDEDSSSTSTQSSDTENPSDDRSPRPRKNEMKRLVSIIYGQIQSLYKASVLLRRLDIHDTYIQSAAGDQNVSGFAGRDRDQILRKLGEWATRTDHKFKEPVDTPYLISRLAAANTKRREQLRFWKEHPNRAASSVAQPAASTKQEPKGVEVFSAGYSQNQLYQIGSETTEATFPEGAKAGSSSATYGSSSLGGGGSLRLPSVPPPDPERLTFSCPLCFSELEVGAMQQSQAWR